MIVDSDYLYFSTHYDSSSITSVSCLAALENKYFFSDSAVESKSENNRILVRIRDFASFAHSVTGIPENALVTLYLSKEGEERLLKTHYSFNALDSTFKTPIDIV